jgi:hypothetical protein
MSDTDDTWDAEYIEGQPWRAGEWHVWDGLWDAYGATLDEAIDELRRNMGDRDERPRRLRSVAQTAWY